MGFLLQCISTITYKVVVDAPAESKDTLPPISPLPYMYSVVLALVETCLKK
jgi:hypothetical protein